MSRMKTAPCAQGSHTSSSSKSEDVLFLRRTALIAALLLTVTACATDATTTTIADPAQEFPVIVEADNGPVTIDELPEAIISLSSTATEMLFAIGAGSQVVAVDDQSNYPADAPMTDLSGITANLEAILSYEPDMVVIQLLAAEAI